MHDTFDAVVVSTTGSCAWKKEKVVVDASSHVGLLHVFEDFYTVFEL